MVHSKMEFVVDWGDEQSKLGEIIKNEVSKMKDVSKVCIKDGAVVVEAELPSSVLVKAIEAHSGRRTVLQGYGDSSSAVAMLSSDCCNTNSTVIGVVRLQDTKNGTIVDATVDGLADGAYRLSVHESGDLSQGAASLGERLPEVNLGSFHSTEQRADFRDIATGVEISSLVGRGMCVSESDYSKILACGVIARSAGMFQNPKRICLCDGITVWDERHRNQILEKKKTCCGGHKL